MFKKPLHERPWYAYAVAACIAVVLYVFLAHFRGLWNYTKIFIGYFRTFILGCVIAYIVNPLSKLLSRTVFRRIRSDKIRTLFSNFFTFLIVILFVIFALVLLIPQLVESIRTFVGNLDGYIASLISVMENLGVAKTFNLDSFVYSSEMLLSTISSFLERNLNNILSATVVAGKGLFQWVIAFILAIYLLAEKGKLQEGAERLMRAVFSEKRYNSITVFLHRCNGIFSRYIVFNLLDSLIIGVCNAIFMTVTGMQYVGLVSFAVAITNLVPTFGPIVGAVIGAFILLMSRPMHALVFLIFTLVLQTCDGYIIKPKLFGNSLGVSGLWILMGVIVGGNIFGVVGILLAIPVVAIIDFLYGTYLLPALERRRSAASKRAEQGTKAE